MELGIASFAAITVIAYLVGGWCKNSSLVKDELIPEVCGTVGGILGAVAFLINVPDFPASDIFNAIAVGIYSGFAATAINQIVKQARK